MSSFGIRNLQLAVGAVALAIAGMAGAQTSDMPAPAQPAAKHHHMHMHKHEHKGQRKYDDNPGAKEDAAARAAQREGKLGDRGTESQYERNALARCGVFKNDEDRHSCTERMRNGQTSGSVKGGGTITEYTEQVPMR
ncbi:hypothetical protein [Comamonas guangdongensis]|uniref:Uncharacterized protein n=1 Tax=Comamonas guangdongensis TaxID=510515 RepID=A0ABV3ZY68_9BURK